MENMKIEALCKWHDKNLRDVTEHEMDSCSMDCFVCDFLDFEPSINDDDDDDNQ